MVGNNTNMKYYNTIIAVLCVVLGIAACTKQETQVENEPVQEIEEPQPSEPQIETMPLSLDASGEAATKTTLSGTTVSWKSSDEISVFDGTLPNQRFTTTDSGTSVTFEGEVSTGATEYYALYPYTSTASLTAGKKITGITLPATQTALAGTFADNLNITVASGSVSDGAASFKNVCSVVRFTLNEPYVTKVTFKGNKNETIAGDLTIDYNSGNPTVEVANPQKEVSIGDGSSVLATGVEYCMVILPADFTAGITLTLQYQSDSQTFWEQWGAKEKKTIGVRTIDKTGSSAIDLARNKILELGAIAMRIVIFEDAVSDIPGKEGETLYGWTTGDIAPSVVTTEHYSGTSSMQMTLSTSKWTCFEFRTKNGNSPVLKLQDAYDAGYYMEFAIKTSDDALLSNLRVRLTGYKYNYWADQSMSYTVCQQGVSASADGAWHLVRFPLASMWPVQYCWKIGGGGPVTLPDAWWKDNDTARANRASYPFLWDEVCKIDFGCDNPGTATNTAIGTFWIDHISFCKYVKP